MGKTGFELVVFLWSHLTTQIRVWVYVKSLPKQRGTAFPQKINN